MVDEKYTWNWYFWGIMVMTMLWIWPREYVVEAGTRLSSSLKTTCSACVHVHTHMHVHTHAHTHVY